MGKSVGLIGGMSWQSTAVYYRLLNEAARAHAGALHSADILLHSLDFAPIAKMQAAGEWDAMGEMLADRARRLERAGASCIVLCTNTMHKLADKIEAAISIPLLHIADVTAAAILATGCRRPLLLATRFTMEESFYKDRLRSHGIEAVLPDAAARSDVHRIIYEELCLGIVTPSSKARYLKIIEDALANGADGVILGCTEIGMLLSQSDVEMPVFDTTQIHVDAAMNHVRTGHSSAGHGAVIATKKANVGGHPC
jgi:aspartate racemase